MSELGRLHYDFDMRRLVYANIACHRPLLPGTCFATELKLLPLAVGPLRMESVRLVEVNTNETTDIKDLPDIQAFSLDRRAVPSTA